MELVAKRLGMLRELAPGANRFVAHLVGEREQRVRNGNAERPGGVEVDDQFEFGSLACTSRSQNITGSPSSLQ